MKRIVWIDNTSRLCCKWNFNGLYLRKKADERLNYSRVCDYRSGVVFCFLLSSCVFICLRTKSKRRHECNWVNREREQKKKNSTILNECLDRITIIGCFLIECALLTISFDFRSQWIFLPNKSKSIENDMAYKWPGIDQFDGRSHYVSQLLKHKFLITAKHNKLPKQNAPTKLQWFQLWPCDEHLNFWCSFFIYIDNRIQKENAINHQWCEQKSESSWNVIWASKRMRLLTAYSFVWYFGFLLPWNN